MPNQSDRPTHDQRTGRFRFAIIGSLLSNPPAHGELQGRLQQLSQKTWTDPQGGQPKRFGVSTLERWYYIALHAPGDPVRALSSVVRSDYSTHPSMKAGLRQLLLDQYRSHPSWSYQLHRDNLVALAQQQPQLAPVPSYSVVRRFMNAHGLVKRPRRGRGDTAGSRAAEQRFECFEVRSYEVPCAHQLWHLDFHSGSLKVLLPDGQWVHPKILGILDDHTRLCVHAQWYLAETAENLIHGLSQALQKHHLPRAILSDNGSAMIAAETVQGLERLGIVHNTTLPHSPYHYVA